MEGLSPIIRWTRTFPYEIVERRFRSAKILVFLDGFDGEKIHINSRDKSLYIYGYNEDDNEACYLKIRLWFKIKKINYRHKNGILTINASGKRFWLF